MSDPERYRQAARRESTTRRYAQVIEHFEGEWGGLLPATQASVARYLAEHAERFSPSTLRTHLAALACWHQEHGFLDPTKAPMVREVLRGIRALHTRPPRQAEPLQLQELEACIQALAEEGLSSQPALRLRACRDRLLLLLGFWRALRSEELCRLRIEFIQLEPARGLTLFLASSKTDRANQGRQLSVPALTRLCPVQAYEDWLECSGLRDGPLLRNVDRWGRLGDGLHSYSVSRILRRAFQRSGLEGEGYSGHSLRRGFATWASANQWSAKALMDYVGWRDVQSAMRYVEADAPFGVWRR
ncbi:site-specific integrase [Pseudomonas chlororaphis]|uniref:site-specific integrase n=1 Tax=Pseudomonas chlororaphis TaxID=587753 RepID=UPI002366746A|nr:site-specific integrase [Pseudomonas chlororaphis]WDH21372.1 site-specific integrase [Pseudomonas chlororaphis]